MLRRTKAELCELSSFKLPPKTFHTVNVELFKEEKDIYEKVLLFSRFESIIIYNLKRNLG